MSNRNKKFVYFFRGDAKERAKVAEFAQKVKNALDIEAILIDMRKDKQAFVDFLEKRSPKNF